MKHPLWTLSILERVSAFQHFAAASARHHERLDGRGYPWGLSGDRLDFTARVLAIADVYEALTADRPYREALAVAQVVDIMTPDRAAAFDGQLLDSACSLAEDGTFARLAATSADPVDQLQRITLSSTSTAPSTRRRIAAA